MSEQKLFDYFSNQHGLVLVNSELHEITLEVCKSIGIDSLEPAEWVEKIKSAYKMFEVMNGMFEFINLAKNEGKPFTSRIQMFEEENNSVDIVLWASVADVCESPIIRVIELRKEIDNLQTENERLKAELANAKFQAWDEGYRNGYVDGIFSDLEPIQRAENPYKQLKGETSC